MDDNDDYSLEAAREMEEMEEELAESMGFEDGDNMREALEAWWEDFSQAYN